MFTRKSRQTSGFVFVAALLAALQALAAVGEQKRARPPQWPKTVKDVFFDDARTKLAGPRPVAGDKPAVVGAPAGAVGVSAALVVAVMASLALAAWQGVEAQRQAIHVARALELALA